MIAAALDTLRIAKRMKDAGFTDAQAEVFAEVMRDAQSDWRGDLATKADLQALESALRADIENLRRELKAEIENVRGELKAGIAEVKFELLRWIVPLMLAQIAATAALVKLL
jgi:hypothetical protein